MWKKQEGKLATKVGAYTREVFMKECFLRMTTSELVDFFNAAPSDVDAGLIEVYWVALAYLGRAFFYRRPQDVIQGEALLVELESSLSFQALASLNGSRERARVSAGAMLPGTDVPASLAMERAMCALLLGRIDEAKRWLGLHKHLPTGDLAVAQFVYSNSPGVPAAWTEQLEACLESLDEDGVALGPALLTEAESGSAVGLSTGAVAGGAAQGPGGAGNESKEAGEEVLLPGLCVLLEVWLREVVSLRFRDTCTEPVVLDTYFDSPDVIQFIEKLPEDRTKKGGAAALGGALGAEAGAVGTRLVTEAVGALKQALQLLPQQVGMPMAPGTPGATTGSTDPWNNWTRAQTVSNSGGAFSPMGGVLGSASPVVGVPEASAASPSFTQEEAQGGSRSQGASTFYPLPTPASENPSVAYPLEDTWTFEPPTQEPRIQAPGTYEPSEPYAPQEDRRVKEYEPEVHEPTPYNAVSIPREGLQDAVGASDGVTQLTKVVAVLATAAASALLVYQASTAVRRGAPATTAVPAVSSRGPSQKGTQRKGRTRNPMGCEPKGRVAWHESCHTQNWWHPPHWHAGLPTLAIKSLASTPR